MRKSLNPPVAHILLSPVLLNSVVSFSPSQIRSIFSLSLSLSHSLSVGLSLYIGLPLYLSPFPPLFPSNSSTPTFGSILLLHPSFSAPWIPQYHTPDLSHSLYFPHTMQRQISQLELCQYLVSTSPRSVLLSLIIFEI